MDWARRRIRPANSCLRLLAVFVLPVLLTSWFPWRSAVAQTTNLVPVWADQIHSEGDPEKTKIHAVAADELLYLAGATRGGLDGLQQYGGWDIFVIKMSISGQNQWSVQIGSEADDIPAALTILPSGVVLVVGRTEGSLDPDSTTAAPDAFAIALSTEGDVLWQRQFGTMAADAATAVTAQDDGGALIAGTTGGALAAEENQGSSDVFILRMDGMGVIDWIQQLGTPETDTVTAIAIPPAGGYVISGASEGAWQQIPTAGMSDAFVTMFDDEQNAVWTDRFGDRFADQANDVYIGPNGLVYVCGQVTLNATPLEDVVDGLFRAYGVGGSLQWEQTIRTEEEDSAVIPWSVTQGETGDLYLAGQANGPLDEEPHMGAYDAFIQRYDLNGTHQWTRMIGSSLDDMISDLAINAAGEIVEVGYTGNNPWDDERDSLGYIATRRADGTRLWQQPIAGTDPGYELAHDVAAAPEGASYVVGYTTGALQTTTSTFKTSTLQATEQAGYVRRYDSQGNIVWTRQDDGTVPSQACAVHVTAGDDAIVYSLLDGLGTVERIDLAGVRLWSLALAPELRTGAPCQTGLDSADNLYVSGWTADNGQLESDAFLTKVTPDGQLAWTKPLPGSGFSNVMEVLADDHIAVAGRGWFLALLTNDGELEIRQDFPAPQSERPVSIVQHQTGAIVVVGWMYHDGRIVYDQDTFISFHDELGSRHAQLTLDIDRYERPWKSIIAADGNVWIVGESAGPGDWAGIDTAKNGFIAKIDPMVPAATWQEFDTGEDDQILSIAERADGDFQIAGYTAGAVVPGAVVGNGDGFTIRFTPVHHVMLPIVY